MENENNLEKFGVIEGGKKSQESKEDMDFFDQFRLNNKDILKDRGIDVNDFTTLSNLFDLFTILNKGGGVEDFKDHTEKLHLFGILKDILPDPNPSPSSPSSANELRMPLPEDDNEEDLGNRLKKAA